MTEGARIASGLEGVVVAETELSHVDGQAGELWIRGHRVEALAGARSFEEAAWQLWTGAFPDDVASLRASLGAARARAFTAIDPNDPALRDADGMDALRALVARVVIPEGASELDRAIALAASVAVAAAAWQRTQRGEALVAPDPSRWHAADVLRMVQGEAPDPARAAALDRYLVTVIDHGMNASTFAARVVASTGSDDVSAIVAAIGALKGPLHGGAPGPVLDMLDAVGAPERAGAWVDAELDAGRRIMGMGHRIYRVRDPRAAVLEAGIEQLERAGVAKGRLALARAVEKEAEARLAARRPDRALRANVEFYTAVILDAVGLDRRAFTPTFAIGRVAGWCAHVAEQRRTGRLIRPASRYVGPIPG
ncbi:citrate synthase [Sandaracinus amylolyticus]|uniref:citrate synthase n=1 Tax=Sandaracinus amylolyticus TaxID=927083 RepID=UPI001F1C13EE|nr:citrate synthase [Sandaracinus amylolyticus]UJR78330.1 Citrate synthase/methylcitrate synthase [Sandaracinus amylolyticus]